VIEVAVEAVAAAAATASDLWRWSASISSARAATNSHKERVGGTAALRIVCAVTTTPADEDDEVAAGRCFLFWVNEEDDVLPCRDAVFSESLRFFMVQRLSFHGIKTQHSE
jgi:hypothetical protein